MAQRRIGIYFDRFHGVKYQTNTLQRLIIKKIGEETDAVFGLGLALGALLMDWQCGTTP